jgi:hypothetical protein
VKFCAPGITPAQLGGDLVESFGVAPEHGATRVKRGNFVGKLWCD